MNLIELFDSLTTPSGNERTLSALPIADYPNYRIAINSESNPVLLLSVTNGVKYSSLRNFKLKYLLLQQNVECKISENGRTRFNTFTVITFTNTDRDLQEYFLRISETLIRTLGNSPNQQQLLDSLNKFIEVFRSLSDIPTNTVHGLWAELFVIENSRSPKTLLNYWHNNPEEKFDFNSGEEKIEVKSNSNFERIHTFSSEQLNPPVGSQVLIASVFVRHNSAGTDIGQLIDHIITKIQNDTQLTEKLNRIVCATLGNTLEQSIKLKFDYKIAQDSLLYYKNQDISKIEEINIPNEVSDVKYKSDLSKITPVNVLKILSKGVLFDSL